MNVCVDVALLFGACKKCTVTFCPKCSKLFLFVNKVYLQCSINKTERINVQKQANLGNLES